MPKIDDYYTDDYPRAGCQLIIDVKREGYQVTVLAPEGMERVLPHGRVLERVFAPSSQYLHVFIDGWRANSKELPPAPDAPCEVMQRAPYETEQRMSPCKQWPGCDGCEDQAGT